MEEHIRKLHGLQQTLHTMGELISDRDFSNTLLTSLPKSWSTFIMAVNAGLLTLTSDALIACILEEYKSRQAGSGGTALKGAERDKKSKRFGATKGKCRNCGKKGHWVKDCWEPGGDKEGQAPKWWKPQEKAKQTKEKSIDNDFAFTSTETRAAAISMSDWLADSVATTHIVRNRSHFMDYISEPNQIKGIALGSSLKTIGRGTIKIDFLVKNKNKIFTVQLKDVKHAPTAPNNLISIRRLTDHNYHANFTRGGVEFQTPQGQTFAEGQKNGQLYQMRARIPNTNKPVEFATAARTWDEWHWTLGHISIGAIKTLKNNNLVEGMDIDKSKESTQCAACIQGRQTTEPFPKQAEDDVTQIGELTVSDVWGLANTEGPSQEQYFYSFTDAKTRRMQIYFSHMKTEVLRYFKEYKALIENQMNNKLKCFCSDGGGKYINEPFKTFCAEAGIIMEQTAPYSPVQNGIAEWIN